MKLLQQAVSLAANGPPFALFGGILFGGWMVYEGSITALWELALVALAAAAMTLVILSILDYLEERNGRAVCQECGAEIAEEDAVVVDILKTACGDHWKHQLGCAACEAVSAENDA